MEVSDTGESVFNDPNYSADDIEQCEDTTFEKKEKNEIIKILAVFARHFLKDFIKFHYDQYEQLSSNVYNMINYFLNYFENICLFVNSCEYRPLATIMYLDYLCKNNILNILVGCYLIFDNLPIFQVCSGQNSNGIQSNIAWRLSP